jgi:hypothetical protein
MARKTILPIGIYSEGTLRSQDLIDALLPELESIKLSREDREKIRGFRLEYDGIDPDSDTTLIDGESIETDMALSDLYQDLCYMADAYTPAYCYFGSTEGDGACIGVWPSVPEDGDGDVYRSEDSPSAEDKTARPFGYWLSVNDHGNGTLYARIGRSWARYREIWSVV